MGARVAARRQRRGRDAVVRRLELADVGSEGSGRDSSPGGAGPGSGAGAVPASLSSARTGGTGALLWGAAPDRLPPASQVTSVRCAPARRRPARPPAPPWSAPWPGACARHAVGGGGRVRARAARPSANGAGCAQELHPAQELHT